MGRRYLSILCLLLFISVSSRPVMGQVDGNCAHFSALAAGTWHSLAMRSDGTVVVWGRNQFGEGNSPIPNRNFVAVAAGRYHNLGLRADSSVVVWGFDTDDVVLVPEPNADFVAVSAGFFFSVGLKSSGAVVAWGSNTDGQLLVPFPNSDFQAISAGNEFVLGLKSDGSVVAWGSNHYGETNVPAPNSDFVAVAAGEQHSLGLKSNGSIAAWGDNSEGQLDVPSPNTGFVAIAAGGVNSLGLKSDGTVVAWGANNAGQLNIPPPNSGFLGVAAGGAHSLALRSDGIVVGWGCSLDDYGQCTIPSDESILCNDGVECTNDICDESTGGCDHLADHDRCNDGVFCNGVEICDLLSGCTSGLPGCDDGLDCTVDSCDSVTDACSHTPNHLLCADSIFCNGSELCDPQIGCVPGPLPNCADNFPCTVDSCDVMNDRCVHLSDDSACSNGLYCDGEETCSVIAGCVSGPAPCAESQRCDEQFQVCEPGNVPAVGAWGLMVLSLMILVCAKLRFPRVA